MTICQRCWSDKARNFFPHRCVTVLGSFKNKKKNANEAKIRKKFCEYKAEEKLQIQVHSVCGVRWRHNEVFVVAASVLCFKRRASDSKVQKASCGCHNGRRLGLQRCQFSRIQRDSDAEHRLAGVPRSCSQQILHSALVHTESIQLDDGQVPASHWNAVVRHSIDGTLGELTRTRPLVVIE